MDITYVFLACVVSGFIGAWIAGKRGKNRLIWFVLCAAFLVFGLILVSVL